MRLSAEQYFTLDQMGIPVWFERHDDAAMTTPLFTEMDSFSDTDINTPWLVLTDDTLSTAENRLLRAIFKSINVQMNEVLVAEYQASAEWVRFSADKTVVLILGDVLSQKISLTPHTLFACQQFDADLLALAAPSLKQLLSDADVKINMWKTIFQLQQLKASQLG